MKIITCKDGSRLYKELFSKFKSCDDEIITYTDERVIKYVEEHREEYSWVNIAEFPDELINDLQIIYILQNIYSRGGRTLAISCLDIIIDYKKLDNMDLDYMCDKNKIRLIRDYLVNNPNSDYNEVFSFIWGKGYHVSFPTKVLCSRVVDEFKRLTNLE